MELEYAVGPPDEIWEHGVRNFKLPKIKIGHALGSLVKSVGGPVGEIAVDAANAAISVVKKEKIQPKAILKDIGSAAINAGAAQAKQDLTTATTNAATAAAKDAGVIPSNNTWILVAGAVALVFLMRKGR